MFFTVLSIELSKIFSKGRSYIGFGAITILVPIVQAAMYSEGEAYFSLFTQGLQQQFSFTGTFLNGYLIAFVVLQSLLVHVPLLVTLVAGDMLAGEATGGTYRLLFTRPVSRHTVVLAKYSAALLYTIGLIAWMSLLSMGMSLLIFGSGELFIVSSSITVLQKDDILWRFGYAYLFGILSMSTVASIAFMFSALVENFHWSYCHDYGNHHCFYNHICFGCGVHQRCQILAFHQSSDLLEIVFRRNSTCRQNSSFNVGIRRAFNSIPSCFSLCDY